MSRYLYALLLGGVLLLGCGGSNGNGSGGEGGDAGVGGEGGSTTCVDDLDCDDDDACTVDTCGDEGACEYDVAEDGSPCLDGLCVVGSCEQVEAVFPCTEQGIRDAIVAGGGPNGIACDGPQAVVTEAEILIDNDVILEGFGNLTVDGNQAHRVFTVAVGTTAELHRLTVRRGATSENGGGIVSSGDLTLLGSTVSESSAGLVGGGVANFGTMSILQSTVSGNAASGNGGGVFNSSMLTMLDSTISENGSMAVGGGVANAGSSLSIERCTLSGNQAAQNGGGISNSNILMLTNSTLSGNSATTAGGALRNDSIVTIQHVTVSGNSAMAGSAISNAGVVMTISGSVVDGECSGSAVGSDGYNIESPGDTCGLGETTDVVEVSSGALGLGPLADNGGATETHALMSGSAALDLVPIGSCQVDEDQRSVTRPQGAACDAGAFELEP